eukprot:TRINITY_DN598_c0_g1_i1.p1 TRINITY_DN598_c0_g1~~TRINITY_DN598_c0_g1_i1.p1  ORF type:complete len:201 (-),score=59.37 TRINITY_DN598_c0_g1_i1:88-654(-)
MSTPTSTPTHLLLLLTLTLLTSLCLPVNAQSAITAFCKQNTAGGSLYNITFSASAVPAGGGFAGIYFTETVSGNCQTAAVAGLNVPEGNGSLLVPNVQGVTTGRTYYVRLFDSGTACNDLAQTQFICQAFGFSPTPPATSSGAEFTPSPLGVIMGICGCIGFCLCCAIAGLIWRKKEKEGDKKAVEKV